MSAPPWVVLVSDRPSLPDEALRARIEAAAAAPPEARARFVVQLRDRALSGRELFARATWLRSLTAPHRIRLCTNDRLDLALAVGADGVHLGRSSVSVTDARALLGPSALISVACHESEDLARADADGADLALFSPVFASPGKGSPVGLAALSAAARAHPHLALIALGGVTLENARACLGAGAAGVASIRADLGPLLHSPSH